MWRRRRAAWKAPKAAKLPKMPLGKEVRKLTAAVSNPDVHARVQVLLQLCDLYLPFAQHKVAASTAAHRTHGPQVSMDKAEKLINLGRGSNHPEEAETALVRAVTALEDICGVGPKSGNRLKARYRGLERARKTARKRPPRQLKLLAFLEQELGLEGKVRLAYEADAPNRAAEGDGCIIYSATYAKAMLKRFRKEGRASVLFGELPAIAKAISVTPDGLDTVKFVEVVSQLCVRAQHAVMKKQKETTNVT